ncbi:MAG: flavin reductase family protein [Candidatus Bathyarchaeota archaeon]
MRKKIEDFQFVEETHRLMRGNGLLLVAESEGEKPNAMTIGWGLVGTMWRRPFFVVAVRLSRHTYKLLEASDSFTVCLPTEDLSDEVEFCGTESGRDYDKFKKLGLTAEKGYKIDAPFIAECPVHYECKIAYKTKVKSGQLPSEIEGDVYPRGDFHVLYYGEIQGVYAEEGAGSKLQT